MLDDLRVYHPAAYLEPQVPVDTLRPDEVAPRAVVDEQRVRVGADHADRLVYERADDNPVRDAAVTGRVSLCQCLHLLSLPPQQSFTRAADPRQQPLEPGRADRDARTHVRLSKGLSGPGEGHHPAPR